MSSKTIGVQKLNGKLPGTTSSPFIKTTMFPVIKIDVNGNIIYANQAGLKIIHDLGCTASRKLPSSLFDANPKLLINTAYTEILIEVKNEKILFSVVGFPEGGYIGLYGFETDKLN